MSETLYREFVLDGPQVARILWAFLKSNCKPFADKGTPLRVIVTEEEMDRLDEQLKYYWGPCLKQIAENAWVEGRKYSKESWHENFAKSFLPSHEIVLPDGEIVIKRGSIARGKISMKAMTKFLMEVESYAASELGVMFDDDRVPVFSDQRRAA